MFIDKDSIEIDGLSMGPFIVEAKFGYHKLWESDTGRNLAGSRSGTFNGIYPKITLQFKKNLTRSQIEQLSPILDAPGQSTKYHDPNKKKKIVMSTYTGDWELVNRGILRNEGFSCAFISNKKRS